MTPISSGSTDTDVHNYIVLFSRGFGQVIFQSNILAGILFIIGVFISSPIAAVYAIVGIALSGILAYLLKVPIRDIYLGLLSYNAVLCAIAFAGKKTENFIMGFISIVLSVFIMMQMRQMNLTALTFPFVLGTWITLMIRWSIRPRR